MLWRVTSDCSLARLLTNLLLLCAAALMCCCGGFPMLCSA
jgi:hypothetical protein